ncbi:uncharacterized protein NEMAJ01_0899 [Nematocida major]|uniref:uncharacterized protein n=1 Tax=Nematocida major TaxID=1912982 RepID=UPI0020077C72|nr:uncharacterized protein NEMAJ01_0899 [Nematocida major]KAH9386003.1 hypothetical protein NEMAJ01_0899 [Nematocida major]
MPIRNFERELTKRQLITKYDIDAVKKNTIGVDGAWFVRKYSPVLKNKNILLDGFNREVLSYVHALVDSLEQADCKIVWIWNGISPKLEARKSPEEKRHDAIQMGWKAYRGNNLDGAQKAWSMAIDYEEVKRQINAILLAKNVEVINAPYLAAAQGAYMESKSYISMFFGATDYFLFSGGENLILDFEFVSCSEKKRVGKISCAFFTQICEQLNIGMHCQSVLLLLGCEYCPTVPEYGEMFDFNAILAKYSGMHIGDILAKNEGQAENTHLADASQKFAKMYLAAKCSVEFHPVLNENSELVCLSSAPAPFDCNAIFGKRIPDEFYSLFSCGEISLEYITGLTMGQADVICSPIVFEALHPVVLDIYRSTKVNISGLFPGEYASKHISGQGYKEAQELGGPDEEEPGMEGLIGRALKKDSELPDLLQWLIVLLDRVDTSLLDKMFMFNRITCEEHAAEEVDWDVFECRESFKFALATIRNKLVLEGADEKELEPVSIDYTNGLKMEEILTLCRKKREHILSGDQRMLIEKNLDYIKKLHRFFNESVNSSRHKRELELLIGCVSAEKMPKGTS